jgi:hypothetical protein
MSKAHQYAIINDKVCVDMKEISLKMHTHFFKKLSLGFKSSR